MAMILSISAPAAYASNEYDVDLGKIHKEKNHVVYICESVDYRYAVYLNTTTGAGSFSIIQFVSPDWLYDLSFTLSPEGINLYSLSFWNNLIDDCFSIYSDYSPVFLPAAVVKTSSDNSMMRTTDPYEDDFYSLLDSKLEKKLYNNDDPDKNFIEPHTSWTITTASNRGTLYMLYESLAYYIDRDNSYYIHVALSITGFIVSVLTYNPEAALISTLAIICSLDGMFEAGSTVYKYSAYALWRRNVRLQNSTINLTNYTKEIRYTGYAYSVTGTCELHDESERVHVSTLYDDIDAQFAEAFVH
jgi:hypothetical protein